MKSPILQNWSCSDTHALNSRHSLYRIQIGDSFTNEISEHSVQKSIISKDCKTPKFSFQDSQIM
jgi:hypothetical protein